jgi:Cellulase (glycosyl hydrolase family 5)
MISPSSCKRRFSAIVGTGALLLLTSTAMGQTLLIGGDYFAIDGIGRFLVFVSYFDGLRRPSSVLSSDLGWLKSKRIDGVRVWPNASSPQLMTADGRLHPGALSNLKSFIDRAAAAGMIVDLTFHREGVCNPPGACGFTIAEYEQAIAATASELRDRKNVLFDLQNEWNVHGDGITMTDLRRIRAAVSAAAPSLIVTASTSNDSVADAAVNAFDVLSYHGPRDEHGSWADTTDDLLASLRAQLALTPRRLAPVYLQEPNRFRIANDTFSGYDSVPAHYWTAVQNAKMAGAAAWTFHTGACFDLSSSTAFSALLQDGELAVIQGLAAALAAQPEWGVELPRPPGGIRIVRDVALANSAQLFTDPGAQASSGP